MRLPWFVRRMYIEGMNREALGQSETGFDGEGDGSPGTAFSRGAQGASEAAQGRKVDTGQQVIDLMAMKRELESSSG